MAKLVPESHPALHQTAEEITQEEIESGLVDKLVKDLNAVGYTCDYGLDASPYDLKQITI